MSHSVQLWRSMSSSWSLPKIEEVRNTGREWLLEALHPLSDIQRCMLLMTLWRVWHNRNELTHQKEPAPMDVSKRFLMSYLDSLLVLQNSECDPAKGKQVISYEDSVNTSHATIRTGATLKWSKPKEGWTKLNIDGSWSDGRADASMVLRDSNGKIIFSSCRELFSCRNALESELCACMEGLSIAIQRTELPIHVEMNSLVAVNMLNEEDRDRSIFVPWCGRSNFC